MQNPLKDKKIRIIILGATSRLTSYKIIPSLFKFFIEGKMPPLFEIIGVGRREWGDFEFTNHLEEIISRSPDLLFKREEWNRFAASLKFISGDLQVKTTYDTIALRLKEDNARYENIFYQAANPELDKEIVSQINNSELAKIFKAKTTKIIFEQPFGHGVDSASELQNNLTLMLNEDRIYRMNHYTLSSIIDLLDKTRQANPIIKDLISSDSLVEIQLTHFETRGVGNRGAAFDRHGIVRDILQANLIDIISSILYNTSTRDIGKAKAEFIKSLEPIESKEIIIGQYQKGMLDGKLVPSYTSEPGVQRESMTPTFVAFKTGLRTEERIIPMYIRAGKRIKTSLTELMFIFRRKDCEPVNILSFRINPKPGIYIAMSRRNNKNVTLNDRLILQHIYKINDNKAIDQDLVFEKNLYKVLAEQRDQFIYYPQLIEAWRFSDLINIAVDTNQLSLHMYPAGGWGPESSDLFSGKSPSKWHSEEFASINRSIVS